MRSAFTDVSSHFEPLLLLFGGAGREDRTPVSRLETSHNSHYTIPAILKEFLLLRPGYYLICIVMTRVLKYINTPQFLLGGIDYHFLFDAVMATAKASAASSGFGIFGSPKSCFTMFCIARLFALPSPVTAFFICAGVNSNTGAPD
jgi:hypothetical protein